MPEAKSLGWWKLVCPQTTSPADTPHHPTLWLGINTTLANWGGEIQCEHQQPPCSPCTLPGAVQPPQPLPAFPLPGVGAGEGGLQPCPWQTLVVRAGSCLHGCAAPDSAGNQTSRLLETPGLLCVMGGCHIPALGHNLSIASAWLTGASFICFLRKITPVESEAGSEWWES